MSPDRLARLAGLLYLSTLPTGGLGVFGAGSFLEASILAGAVCAITWLVLVILFYELFRSASDRACKLLLVFVVASCTLMLAALARRMDALSLVAEGQALAAYSLRSSENLMQFSVVFWGLWLLPLGWLVFRSGFLPKTLGVLLMLGAPFYVGIFLGAILDPEYETSTLAKIVGIASGVPGTAGELGTALWLLIRGRKA
jgi:hypothetical protein